MSNDEFVKVVLKNTKDQPVAPKTTADQVIYDEDTTVAEAIASAYDLASEAYSYGSTAKAAYSQANDAYNQANDAYNMANDAYSYVSRLDDVVENAYSIANDAYNAANDAYTGLSSPDINFVQAVSLYNDDARGVECDGHYYVLKVKRTGEHTFNFVWVKEEEAN